MPLSESRWIGHFRLLVRPTTRSRPVTVRITVLASQLPARGRTVRRTFAYAKDSWPPVALLARSHDSPSHQQILLMIPRGVKLRRRRGRYEQNTMRTCNVTGVESERVSRGRQYIFFLSLFPGMSTRADDIAIGFLQSYSSSNSYVYWFSLFLKICSNCSITMLLPRPC